MSVRDGRHPGLRPRPLRVAVLAGLILLAGTAAVLAGASPFGVGLPDTTVGGGPGLFPGLFRTVALWQARFYHEMTATLKAMRTDGSAGLWLAGVSFLYGIFHAVGPGHGKAVISAYVLANRQSAKNGALLAMVSALVQGVTAVALVSVAAIALKVTSIAMTEAAEAFDVGSFALITALGLWFVVRKVVNPLVGLYRDRYAPIVIGAPAGPAIELSFGTGGSPCRHGRYHGLGGASAAGVVACGCGHAHVAAPESVDGPLDWKRAASTIVAVGARPCTGALIVLVFALSQGIYAAGVMSAFAMAIGTGMTVSLLTLSTIFARSLALRFARVSGGAALARIQAVIEGLAAVAILLFGTVMLGASLINL